MKYIFYETNYSNQEGDAGDFGPEDLQEISLLRRFYPEISHWGNLAVYLSWEFFSDDVHLTGWQNVLERDETFLDYLCWKQTHGLWSWGDDSEKLSSMRTIWAGKQSPL